MNKKIIPSIIAILIIGVGAYFLLANNDTIDSTVNNNENIKNTEDNNVNTEASDTNTNTNAVPFTQEDVDEPEIAYSNDGMIRAEFIGPEEIEFTKGQARKWDVEIENADEESSGKTFTCDWTYTLEGIIEQELTDYSCAFTTTFIQDPGTLIVDAKVNILQGKSVFDDNGEYVDYVKEVVETLEMQREFVVTSPVDTYVHP